MKTKRMLALIGCGLLLAAGTAIGDGQDEVDRLSFSNEDTLELVWGGYSGTEITDDNWVKVHIEDLFNVDITNTIMHGGRQEALNTMLAAGEHPDVLWGFIDMVAWFNKGAFRTIPRDMIERYAPNYSEFIDNEGPVAWGVSLAPGSTDEYMNLPRAEHYQQGCDRLATWRLDWLREIGMDPAGLDGKAPKLGELNGLMHDEGAPREGDPAGMPDTFYMWFGHFDWDEVESIMAGFRATDFNGNGQQDEIPFGSLGAGEGSEAQDIVFFMGLGMVFDAFGVNSVENYYDPEQDMTVREDTYSQSREALKVLQRWFQLGYLDQNLPAVSRAEWEQRWQNGLTGMWSRGQSCGTSSRYGSPGGHCGTVVKNVPEAKLVTTLPMIGPTGIARCPFDGRATPMNPGMGYSIKHDVTDAELARILQIFDYLNYDSQGIIHGQWGPPGLFFDWNGKDGAAGTPYDCINSWMTPKEGVSGYGQHYGFFYYNAYHWHDGFRFCVTNKDRNDLTEGLTWDAFMKQNPYIQEISTPDHREDIFTQTDYLPLWAEFGDGLSTLKQETWWRYITTDVDIDADWQRYVDEWMSIGGREVLDELNKAPLVSDIRAGAAHLADMLPQY